MARFEWVMRKLRVRRLNPNCSGAVSMYRSVFSNHSRLTWAARCRLAAAGLRSSS